MPPPPAGSATRHRSEDWSETLHTDRASATDRAAQAEAVAPQFPHGVGQTRSRTQASSSMPPRSPTLRQVGSVPGEDDAPAAPPALQRTPRGFEAPTKARLASNTRAQTNTHRQRRSRHPRPRRPFKALAATNGRVMPGDWLFTSGSGARTVRKTRQQKHG
uniref:TC3_47I12.2 n=1 Tax=Trypanosoma cruzi TaxID=5693 RepID=Q8T2X5_TRYCR|nr:TC3_47I12.2 [Trypanosoma cruzi]